MWEQRHSQRVLALDEQGESHYSYKKSNAKKNQRMESLKRTTAEPVKGGSAQTIFPHPEPVNLLHSPLLSSSGTGSSPATPSNLTAGSRESSNETAGFVSFCQDPLSVFARFLCLGWVRVGAPSRRTIPQTG